MTNSIMNATNNAIQDIFLLRLSATSEHIGILAAINELKIAARILGLKIVSKTGKARLGSMGRTIAAPAVVLKATIALLALRFPHAALWLTLGLVAVHGLTQSAGDLGWWPLMQDNTSESSIGAFLARMRVRLRILDIALPLGVGWYLGTSPSPARFAPLFLIAAVVMGVGAIIIRKIPEVKPVDSSIGVLRRLISALRVPSIRQFCFYVASQSFFRVLAQPFWIVLLSARGLPVAYIVWSRALLSLGQAIGLPAWARLSDRHGSKPVLSATLLPYAFMGIAWLFLPNALPALLVWAVVFFVICGTIQGGMHIADTRAMFQSIPKSKQLEGFVAVEYISATVGGIGGIIGGILFGAISGGKIPLATPTTYLCLIQALTIISWFASTRFEVHAEQPSLTSLMQKAVRALFHTR